MMRYVDNQNEHHRKGIIKKVLEEFRTHFEEEYTE